MDAEGDVYRKEPPENWCPPHTPLYAHPQPNHEWLGLTDEEVAEYETWYDEEEERKGWVDCKLIVEYFEAKLREKNT
jgi:hypothetical protein